MAVYLGSFYTDETGLGKLEARDGTLYKITASYEKNYAALQNNVGLTGTGTADH